MKRTPIGPPAARPSLEVIARLAELMWEREGYPKGRDIEYWRRAEAALNEDNAPNSHDDKR